MRLLIIGTLNGQLGAATKIAMDRGAKVSHVESPRIALESLRAGRGADLLMIDVEQDIAGLIEALKTEHICLPVVACGIGTDARAAVEAIRSGAKEYIPLPPDADLIAAVLEAVSEDSRQLIYGDPATQRVIDLADQIAPSDASVLITGESGTGKEVMAAYVHSKSRRADQAFISVNCAAIPENLLESELFGHEKGAFTGAIARRVGKFEEADGGTLLLDEISEMDIRLQAKLLRALQERKIDRVGGSRPVPVNIRVIATSNRNLADEVQKGTFREDRLYRLNVVNLSILPLRERKGDIFKLANHFIQKYSTANGVEPRPLSEAARHNIENFEWRGNVRELENAMHRAVLLAKGDRIDADAIRLPDGTKVGQSPTGFGISRNSAGLGDHSDQSSASLVGKTVAEMEQDLILQTLDHCLGNRTHAANILGISIRTLRNKLKTYTEAGVEVPHPGEDRASSVR